MDIKEIVVAKDEEKTIPLMWIDGKKDQVKYVIRLRESGASVKFIGVFVGSGRSEFHCDIHVIHQSPHTRSTIDIRCVLTEYASFENSGMITIQKGAKGADAFFHSRILLFDNAKGMSIPSLEIDENEVKAGHGSTIGRLDFEELFYLQSRGLSEKRAKQLMVSGFLSYLFPHFTSLEKRNCARKIQKMI